MLSLPLASAFRFRCFRFSELVPHRWFSMNGELTGELRLRRLPGLKGQYISKKENEKGNTGKRKQGVVTMLLLTAILRKRKGSGLFSDRFRELGEYTHNSSETLKEGVCLSTHRIPYPIRHLPWPACANAWCRRVTITTGPSKSWPTCWAPLPSTSAAGNAVSPRP